MKKGIFSFFVALLATLPLLAEEGGEAAASKQGGLIQTVIMIAVAVVFFYFILWRPEQKRRKQMETIRNTLKKGDRVTAMGIIGTVHKIQDTTVVIALYDGAKMEVMKAAITDVQAASDEKAEKTVEASESK